MNFQFKIEYTFQDLLAFNRASAWLFRKWRVRMIRFFPILLGTVLLAEGLLVWANYGIAEIGLFYVLYPVVVGALLLAVGLGHHHFNAFMSRRLLVKRTGAITVTLGEEDVVEESGIGSSRYPYSTFQTLARYKSYTFLFVDKKHAIILSEETMTQGDGAALQRFLEEKCGKAVTVIR